MNEIRAITHNRKKTYYSIRHFREYVRKHRSVVTDSIKRTVLVNTLLFYAKYKCRFRT